MQHSFLASALDSAKCQKCARDEKAHGKEAQCEACPNIGECEIFNNILMCRSCLQKEYDLARAQVELKNEVIIERAKEIDDKVQTKYDFFNAETVAIEDLRKAIDADEKIINKPFELARLVKERYLKHRVALFEITEKQFELIERRKAEQIYLNGLANKLRAEERETLKIQDVTYTPEPIKVGSKTPKRVKLSADEAIAANYAKLMKIPIEKARLLISQNLKTLNVDCTCASTPGICKLHHAS